LVYLPEKDILISAALHTHKALYILGKVQHQFRDVYGNKDISWRQLFFSPVLFEVPQPFSSLQKQAKRKCKKSPKKFTLFGSTELKSSEFLIFLTSLFGRDKYRLQIVKLYIPKMFGAL
jgi:hypothetical protein